MMKLQKLFLLTIFHTLFGNDKKQDRLMAVFYFLLYTQEESVEIEKFFDFRVLMDLRVLKCPVDLTFFGECLSVCCQTFFLATLSHELVHVISKFQTFSKLQTQFDLDINWS